MTRKEYKEISDFELYRGKKYPFFKRFSIKHLQPNTNCMYLARKMWYLYSRGGIRRLLSRYYYLRIIHRFGCQFYSNITVGRGFRIEHPVGIVIGKCSIGENFTVYQNTSVGLKHQIDGTEDKVPRIGNNVKLCSGSGVFGDITVADNVLIGANSLVIKSITEPGTYAGSPCRRIG